VLISGDWGLWLLVGPAPHAGRRKNSCRGIPLPGCSG